MLKKQCLIKFGGARLNLCMTLWRLNLLHDTWSTNSAYSQLWTRLKVQNKARQVANRRSAAGLTFWARRSSSFGCRMRKQAIWIRPWRWNVSPSPPQHKLSPHTDISWKPDGRAVAIGNEDGWVSGQVWLTRSAGRSPAMLRLEAPSCTLTFSSVESSSHHKFTSAFPYTSRKSLQKY